ncbi:Cyclic nucleotide-binding-like [Phytophthora cactorum]|nr:Cyclic nucleotide-binding-like [Phytophthora cactorum]
MLLSTVECLGAAAKVPINAPAFTFQSALSKLHLNPPPLTSPFRKPRAQEPHRHVPLTRARCDPVTHEAGPMQVEYYSQRAGAGLIITEAVAISVQGFGWYGAPCLYTEAHRDSWKPVVEAVHAKGAKIFLQIWHIGRQGHPSFSGDVVGPSAIGPVSGHTRDFNAEKAPYELCRELKTEEISEVINDFCKSARLAKEAGFDGVDIHAANGYLPDTFLQSSTNKRTDKYGGSIENRARFLLELVEALQNEWLADRIGLRLSPNGFYGDTGSADNYEMCCYVAEKLSKYGLAYLATLDGFGFGFQDKGPLTKPFDVKKNFKGTVMAANSYTRDTAEGVLLSGAADLVSFGRPFISNPDLAERFLNDWALNEPAGLFKPEVPPHLLKLLQKTPEEQERVAAARAILMDEPALRNEQSLDLVYSWMLQNCKQYSNNIFGAAPEYIRREICRQMRLMKVKSGGSEAGGGRSDPSFAPPMLSTMKQRRTSRRLSSEVNSAPVDFGAWWRILGQEQCLVKLMFLFRDWVKLGEPTSKKMRLVSAMRSRHFTSNFQDYLYRAGTDAKWMFIVTSGEVMERINWTLDTAGSDAAMRRLVLSQSSSRKNPEKIVNVELTLIGSGDIAGELPFVASKRGATFDIKAVTDVQALAIDRRYYETVMLTATRDNKPEVYATMKKLRKFSQDREDWRQQRMECGISYPSAHVNIPSPTKSVYSKTSQDGSLSGPCIRTQSGHCEAVATMDTQTTVAATSRRRRDGCRRRSRRTGAEEVSVSRLTKQRREEELPEEKHQDLAQIMRSYVKQRDLAVVTTLKRSPQ